MSARKTLRKWDAALARELLENASGKDKLQVKVLELVKGVFHTTSMLRRVFTINNLPDTKRATRIADLQLTEKKFKLLHAFCKNVSEHSWRDYTAEEQAMHVAAHQFQNLKRTREPMEWAAKVSALPEQERAHTACVIWWDLFADLECTKRFKPFDQWLNGFKPTNFISNAALRRNLIAIGYPEMVAERRVLGEDIEETEELETV